VLRLFKQKIEIMKENKINGKSKVVAVFNELSTTPRRRAGGGGIAPPFLPWKLVEVSCQLRALAALLAEKEPPVPIG
jgi:hypothetical protein